MVSAVIAMLRNVEPILNLYPLDGTMVSHVAWIAGAEVLPIRMREQLAVNAAILKRLAPSCHPGQLLMR